MQRCGASVKSLARFKQKGAVLVKNKKLKAFVEDLKFRLTPVIELYLVIICCLVFGILPGAWILVNAKKLSYAYPFLQAGHLLLLAGIAKFLNVRKEHRDFRAILRDDELFYSIYPSERFFRNVRMKREAWIAKRDEARKLRA